MARYLLEEQPVGNVVGSQESRHQVGDGPSLAAVRPEQERAQTSFPAEQVRQALGQQGPLVHTAQDPTGWACTPSSGPAPGETVTQLTQGTLETAPLKMQRPGPMPRSQETLSLGNRGSLVVEGDSALSSIHSSPPLFTGPVAQIHRSSEQEKP